MEPVVTVQHLAKAYGAQTVLRDVNFTVEARTVFALVGPNGAGKTTTVECIEGLRVPDSGEARIFGLDPRRERQRVYRRLGVQLQESSLYQRIRLGEALALFATLYPESVPSDRLLAEFGLADKVRSYYGDLSGGQKRKFLTALALVGRPELLILDEPTSGLDPQSRHGFWAALGRYRRDGLTVLLTTHDLQEAEEYSDMVGIIDRGEVVALGRPADLVRDHGLGTRVVARRPDHGLDLETLRSHPGVSRVEEVDERVFVYGAGDDFLAGVTRLLRDGGSEEIASRPANLEDVYLILTGRGYQKGEEASP